MDILQRTLYQTCKLLFFLHTVISQTVFISQGQKSNLVWVCLQFRQFWPKVWKLKKEYSLFALGPILGNLTAECTHFHRFEMFLYIYTDSFTGQLWLNWTNIGSKIWHWQCYLENGSCNHCKRHWTVYFLRRAFRNNFKTCCQR